MSTKPTVDRLRELFEYRSDGALVWRERSGRGVRHRAGSVAGTLDRNGHRRIGVDRRMYGAHQIVWAMHHGSWPNGEIDHINRVRDDNRIENLRAATHAQNMRNVSRRSDNTSGIRGVYFRKEIGKWGAYITLNGKTKALGVFDNIESARARREAATRAFHGEFGSPL